MIPPISDRELISWIVSKIASRKVCVTSLNLVSRSLTMISHPSASGNYFFLEDWKPVLCFGLSLAQQIEATAVLFNKFWEVCPTHVVILQLSQIHTNGGQLLEHHIRAPNMLYMNWMLCGPWSLVLSSRYSFSDYWSNNTTRRTEYWIPEACQGRNHSQNLRFPSLLLQYFFLEPFPLSLSEPHQGQSLIVQTRYCGFDFRSLWRRVFRLKRSGS